MLQSAEAHGAEQARLAALTGVAVRRMRVAPEQVHESWVAAIPAVLRVTVAAQVTAVRNGPLYVADALAEQNIDATPDVEVATRPLVGVAGDGRPLATLADVPRWQALDQISAGVEPAMAVQSSLATLATMMATAVQDAGRASETIAIATRGGVGYTRMLVGDSCSRCVVLAGKFYRYNAGFDRHPKDDCVHIPTTENVAGDVTTDPRAYFDSLTEADQDRRFTKAGAEAIRSGADIGQVVNARRGATGMAPAGARLTKAEQRILQGGRDRGGLQRRDVFGQQVFTTTEGTTRRGVAYRELVQRGGRATDVKLPGARYKSARAPRLMPESIAEIAADRADYLRLLKLNGYIR